MSQTASSTDPTLSPIKRALRAVEDMQAKLEAITYAQREPIAIIGMGCRFPGEADSPDAFWELLEHGVDAIGDVPPSRWDVETYYNADPDAPGKIYTREGGFLADIESFDASFFGISAREASSLDPQQRLLLEVSWEALEQANQASDRVFDSTTGVFIGICSNDYNKMIWESGGAEQIDAFCATGNALSLAAGRLSYALGLKGPSLSVDTACSSALVALHLACQHLRGGECDLALAGGVHLLLAPDSSVAFARTRMLDPSGRCRTFDAEANGYVRGEGCGVIVLKRLSDALRDRDAILAVVQGSAVNHNGRSSSLVAPNGLAQQSVIRKALDMAGVEPQQVGYVEVQGTGTSVGQSLEVGALAAVLGSNRSADQPLMIGSVKTNLGHLEGASGIASLIKVVLALQHQTIPPHLHFRQPNPHINWADWPVQVPTEAQPWPGSDSPRLAGINCFGFSGTNAHVILAEAPKPSPAPPPTLDRPLHLLALSAKNPESLRGLAQRYHRYLAGQSNLADVCFTANTGRSHFSHRLALVATTAEEMGQHLESFLNQSASPMVWTGEAVTTPKIALVFPAIPNPLGLGRKLYDTHPLFRKAIDRCQDILQADLDTPLVESLYPAQADHAAPLNQASTQATLFAVQYGLYQLWKSWGVEPALLLGAGVGQYVAACAAGVYSLEAGFKLVMNPTQPPVNLASPKYPLWSSTGQPVTTAVTDPGYWQALATSSQAMPLDQLENSLTQEGITTAIVIGPGESLNTIPDKATLTWLASLDASGDWQTLLASLATLYSQGAAISWTGFDQPYSRQYLHLPTYPWRRKRYWYRTPGAGQKLVLPTQSVESLTQQLAATGSLSEAELKLVPKLLALLTQPAVSAEAANTPPTSPANEPSVDLKTVTAADIQNWLVNRIAQELGVEPQEINPEAPFDSYGLDSVLAIGIASAGKQYLGVEVTPLMLVHHPTIAALAKHLLAEFEASGTEVFEL
jgi:acyl transferase domain-containing protein